MDKSIQLAGLIGPVLIALSVSETIHLRIWEKVSPAIVYLNGLLLFIGGLATVRVHNQWVLNWTVLITLIGWVAMAAGLYRMFAPEAPQANLNTTAYVFTATLFTIGIVLSYKSYIQ
ncbi:MAG: hypothetical protein ACFB0B_00510 [Thermonemataceae bacterium]